MQPTERVKRMREAKLVTDRICNQLLEERKSTLRLSVSSESEGVTKDAFGQDLLSLLVKANMATDVPENQRVSDKEVLARRFLSL